MDLIETVDERIRSFEFDFSDVLEDANLDDLAAVMRHCVLNSGAVELVVLNNLSSFLKLTKSHWQMIVGEALRKGDDCVSRLLKLVQIYCRVDESYLCDIGIPFDSVRKVVTAVSDPSFPYGPNKSEAKLSGPAKKLRELKKRSIEDIGLSQSDVLNLYNMFTDDEGNSTTT